MRTRASSSSARPQQPHTRSHSDPPLRCGRGRAALWRAFAAALVFAAPRAARSVAEGGDTLGWLRGDDALAGPCTVERRAWTELSTAEFDAVYLEQRPVVLTGLPNNAHLRALCGRERLLADWGDAEIVLSTANTYSYKKVRSRLSEYVAKSMAPQPAERSGRETLYHFGDNNHTEWAPLLSHYAHPPFIPPSAHVSLSFGLAGPGSGVPFHIHGAGYSETIHGRKRWLLYAPERRPPFDPDESTLTWLRRLRAGAPELALHGAPEECTIAPGEALYFPTGWWHATLNVDEAVFVSTFVAYATPQPRAAAALFAPRRAGGGALTELRR